MAVMATKHYFFLAVSLFSSWQAQGSDDPSPEEVFRLLCDRHAPQGASRDDRKLRAEFQNFLRSPELTARALERSLSSDARDLGSEIEVLFQYSQTCFLVETHARELASKGCRNGNKKIDASRAQRACAPVITKFAAAARKAKEAGEAHAGDNAVSSEETVTEGNDAREHSGTIAPAL